MKRLVLALALVTTPLLADSRMPDAPLANRQLPDAAKEAEARALMETIRCLTCQGQSVLDSDAEMAADMRALIRTRIGAGEQPEAIRGWLIERYGDWISYEPELTGKSAPLWIAPLLLLGVGGVLVARRLGKRRT